MEKELVPEIRLEQIPGEYGRPIPLELFYRELGVTGSSRHKIGRRVVSQTLATKAVHTLCTKEKFDKKVFKLPVGARTTFHLAFSADGSRVASCHGDHNVYVCDVGTGNIIQTLTGHPRTPWCVVFHPTQNDILASGCLAGHIRVWDLKGGSEVLVTDSGTVIASLAFHPTVRLLAIATFNEIIFWDWGLPHPLARCSTQNTKEKVRLVRFDRLGQSLITGITNFPNPPGKSSTKGAQSNSYFRPNILSRNQRAGSAGPFRPGSSGSFYAYPRRPPEEQSGNGSEASARTGIPATADHPASNNPSADRQERFQESYRQLVHHYQDLVSNYQQFLRSRIPRLLETSRIIREDPETFVPPVAVELNPDFESPASSSDNSLDGSATVSLDISPNPVIIPEIVTDAAEMEQMNEPIVIEEEILSVPREPISQLEGLEARLIEHMESDMNENGDIAIGTAQPAMQLPIPIPSTASTSNNPGPSESGLQNIEALAQNIIEMQNLCSRARRDAPLAVENNHIRELQNIRRHLEVLQDQTRELQSSIRATLSSLARGSLDVLNSGNGGAESGVGEPVPRSSESEAGTPRDEVSSLTAEPADSSRSTSEENDSLSENSFITINVSGNQTSATVEGGMSHPGTFSRVPPVVPMQYGLADSSTPLASNNEEPVPGPSRQMHLPRAADARRLVREFHVVHGPTISNREPEHARNCPFGTRDGSSRPPARMRCLTEMGENPTLAVWPPPELSEGLPLRSQRVIELGNRNTNNYQPLFIDRNSATSAANGDSFSNYPMPSAFSQWMNNGPYWVNNALGVNIFLNVRQSNEAINEVAFDALQYGQFGGSLENNTNEQWQRTFIAGLGLVPPTVREGRRHQYRRTRRGQNVIYQMNQGQGRVFTLRPSEWDEFRSSFLSQNCELGSLPWNSPYLHGSSSESPASLGGDFNRSYSLRIGDEIVPVYTNRRGDEISGISAGEIREGPVPYVYIFPIGLFIDGESVSGGPQSVGLFWPSISRDEEEQLRELRRTEAPVPVWTEQSAVSNTERQLAYRLDFDHQQLRIRIDPNCTLILIQPGLILLDAVTTFANWSRPRPVSGTVYISHLSPFLDALERLFGHRMRRIPAVFPTNSTASASRSSSHYNNQPSPPMGLEGIALRMSTVMQPTLLGSGPSGTPQTARRSYSSWVPIPIRQNSSSRSIPDFPPPRPSDIQLQTLNPELYSRSIIQRFEERSRSNPRRLISFSGPDGEPSDDPRNEREQDPYRSARAAAARRSRDIMARRREYGLEVPGSPSDQMSMFVSIRGRARPAGPPEAGRGNSDGNRSNMGTSATTRRFIRFAVDTATAEVLRRHPNTTSQDAITLNQSVQRAIESRIERVLNERGNRGYSGPQPFMMQVQDSDLEMRVSMQSVPPGWGNRNVSTSGTQTTQSFIRSASDASTSTSAGTSSTGVGTSTSTSVGFERQADRIRNHRGRRRAFSRFDNERNNGDSDEDPPPPPRMPRLTIEVNQFRGEGSSSQPTQAGAQNNNSNEPVASTSSSNDTQPPALPPRRGVFSAVNRGLESRLRARESRIPSLGNTARVNITRLGTPPRSEPLDSVSSAAEGLLDLSENSSRARAESSGAGPSGQRGQGVPQPRSNTQDQGPSNARASGMPRQPMPAHFQGGADPASRFYPGYIPEILITPRLRSPYYAMDASTTAYLSSRIQKWNFSDFCIPDITRREESVVVGECSLHSDACLDISSDSEFLVVLQPSDNGSYSAVGIYSLRDETLGDILHVYHFDQNTVSISIAPSCDYMVVAYAGRGPFYRFVNPSRSIGQILSLSRNGNEVKLIPVKELYAESQNSLMSINCMHFVPVPGYGILYGTNTGDLILLS